MMLSLVRVTEKSNSSRNENQLCASSLLGGPVVVRLGGNNGEKYCNTGASATKADLAFRCRASVGWWIAVGSRAYSTAARSILSGAATSGVSAAALRSTVGRLGGASRALSGSYFGSGARGVDLSAGIS